MGSKKPKSKSRRRRSFPPLSAPAKPAPEKAPLSLCMIVKNEERFLAGCLESVSGLVSEMIVVDTGSADRTVEIAREYGAKVFSVEWKDDFALARNFGLEQATQPWILYLDADERLHPSYHRRVREAILADKADAFYLRVRSEVGNILGNVPHVQAYPRVFRNGPQIRFEGRIHEQITPAIHRMNGRFALVDAEIEHLGYNLSEAEMKAKIQRNLASLLQQVEEEPDNAYALFQLGQTYLLADQFEKGEHYLLQSLQGERLSPPLRATALLILANEALKTADYAESIKLTRQAIAIAPKQRLGYFLLSECLASQGKYHDALEALQKYDQFKDELFTDISIDKTFDVYLIAQRQGIYHFNVQQYSPALSAFLTYFASAVTLRVTCLQKFLYALQQSPDRRPDCRETLAALCQNLEKFDDPKAAIQNLGGFFEADRDTAAKERLMREACRLFPDEAGYRYFLGNACLEQQRYDEAELHLHHALRLSSSTYEIYFNLAVVAIKQEDYRKALHWFEIISRLFPDHAQTANRYLAGLHMKLGDTEQARQLAASNR